MQKHPTKPDRLPATSLLNIQSDPLAEQINAEHRACVEAANGALDHAMRTGDLLSEAKAACKHGEWQNWLADNFEGSTRTAQVYMRLAGHRSQLAKAQSPALLTIYEASQLIGRSRDLGLPPDVEAELAPISAEIRRITEELDDSDRETRHTLQEARNLFHSESDFYMWAKCELGMEKREIKEILSGASTWRRR